MGGKGKGSISQYYPQKEEKRGKGGEKGDGGPKQDGGDV